ncbi:unnamed protein product [Owenia fusiformis]|uniref:Uncharacterized protein n=1 Tax=Owenia fusiformis TaxID=6347 RepID=A0A8J1TU18_OWEFU|nr:unnamed protein product [Owenia fusiformis]
MEMSQHLLLKVTLLFYCGLVTVSSLSWGPAIITANGKRSFIPPTDIYSLEKQLEAWRCCPEGLKTSWDMFQGERNEYSYCKQATKCCSHLMEVSTQHVDGTGFSLCVKDTAYQKTMNTLRVLTKLMNKKQN